VKKKKLACGKLLHPKYRRHFEPGLGGKQNLRKSERFLEEGRLFNPIVEGKNEGHCENKEAKERAS